MRPPAVLAALAVLLWLAALWPAGDGEGRRWLLVDASDSAGGRAAARAILDKATEAAGRRFLFANGLTPAAGGGWPEADASRLGAALRDLRARLRPGDRLRVVTDGRATDLLPPAGDWAGVRVDWERPPPRPRIAAVRAPASWPGAGPLELEVVLADADLEAGELQVEVAPPGILAGPAGLRRSGSVLGVVLRAERLPEKPVTVRLRWVEGTARSQRDVVLPPAGRLFAAAAPGLESLLDAAGALERSVLPLPGPGLILARPGDAEAAQVAAWLAAGQVVLLAGSAASDWLALPGGLRPLVPDPDPGAGMVVLLDRSGSMGEEGRLEEARAMLLAWARTWPADHALTVLPFAEVAGIPFDPRAPAGRRQLAALLPHGGTDLAGALDRAGPALGSRDVLVLLSDGLAPPPPEGWAARGEALAATVRRVLCVPVGPRADRVVLGALGELVEAPGSLGQRLLEALAQGTGTARGPALALPGLPWTLPERIQPASPRARYRAAPGALPLLRGADGAVLLAARMESRGVLLGLGTEPTSEILRALLPLVREALGAPRLWREGDALLVRGGTGDWRVRALPGGPWLPLDPIGEDLRQARPLAPGAVLEVAAGGSTFRLPAAATEELAGTAPWSGWLKSVDGLTAPPSGPRGLLQVAALLAAVGAAGLAARGSSARRFPAGSGRLSSGS